jgi:arginine/lysine/ornithine decarboxylase
MRQNGRRDAELTVLPTLRVDARGGQQQLAPAESAEKMAQLVAMLGQFEQHIEADTPLADVLPIFSALSAGVSRNRIELRSHFSGTMPFSRR